MSGERPLGATGNEASESTSRRALLRGAAAATAAGLGLAAVSGPGAARETTVEDVGDVGPAEVEAALATDGAAVLETLRAEGFLEAASPSVLPTRTSVGVGDVAANVEGTATVRGSEGLLRHLTVTDLADGALTVVVVPAEGRGYAYFEPADEDERYLYDPRLGLDGIPQSEDVGTSASCDCRPELCSTGAYLEECESCHCGTDCGPPDYCCCDYTYGCC